MVQDKPQGRKVRLPSIGRVAVHTILIVGSLVCIFPFFYMITKSFNSVFEANAWPPVWIPERWRILNYSAAWSFVTFGPTVEIEDVAGLCEGRRCNAYIEFWAIFLALANILLVGVVLVALSKRVERLRNQPSLLVAIGAILSLPTLVLFLFGTPCRVENREGYLPIEPTDPARAIGRVKVLEVLGYDREWSYQPPDEYLLSWEADRELVPAIPISFWRFLGLFTGAAGDKVHRGYVLNTIIVSAINVPAVLITSVLAAYAFAQFEFFGKNLLFTLFLSTMMIPPQATLIPNYIAVAGVLRWHDTFMALTVPFMASVFNVFLLRQFFMTIPSDYYDAARLDGAGHLGYLRHVVLPMSQSPLAVVTLFTFLGTWNSFQWPLIMVRDVHQLIQPGMSGFSGEGGTDTQLVMAAATFSVLPVAILYFMTQRTFIESVATSGLKG